MDLSKLEKLYPFKLDPFQIEAIETIEDGKSVIVCAPTGSGKTVVAEYAVRRALARGRRCFYTTPLKALSNQKFGDLRRLLGDDEVGLLTGDISVNRNASVVVMTTEVYRNMLYGTILGDVRTNLDMVDSVIIDECHYMNDPDRGTVWEELVIYSPKAVQLVALSATVANAEALTAWFEKVHGPTHLVRSEHRSVPLSFYYYYDGALYDLLNRKRKLNPQLRSIVENANKKRERLSREERQERREAKRAAYFPEKIVKAMEKEKMLPAIFFLFSRKRCDEAVQFSDKAVTLTLEEKERLNRAIDEALDEHPSLQDNPHLKYLRQGVAAHHAGLLPMWKMLVENLFQQGLIKVVYATETLAAGINMPARSTVISAIAKFSDEGLRPMTASEFLQMSGRAGRRGMDERGNVVVVCHPNEPVEQAAELAAAPADPLVSHFTPGYGMVLNLLQRHTMEESKELIERSFGQFVADNCQMDWQEQIAAIDAQLEARASNCLGGPDGQTGDVAKWKELGKKASNLGQKYSTCRRALAANALPGYKEAAEAAHDEVRAAKAELAAYPCSGCEHRVECQEWLREKQKITVRRKELQNQLKLAQTSYWEQFQNLVKVLQRVGYVDKSYHVLEEGLMASSLRATNILFLNEVALSGVLETLEPVEVAGVISALVLGDSRSMPEYAMRPSYDADEVIEAICSIADKVEELQKMFNVSAPVLVNSTYAGLVEYWCRGAYWEEMRDYLGWEEGDMMRLLRRTLDVLQQLVHAPGMPQVIVDRCQGAIECLDRDEVREAAMWSE